MRSSGLPFDLRDQLLIIARRDRNAVVGDHDFLPHHLAIAPAHRLRPKPLHRNRADPERITEMRRDLFELHHALRIGLLVNAEDRCDVRLLQVRRHGFVRRQHELFDQAVRDVARAARDAGHLAKLVEFDQRLRHIEIDGAAPDAFLVQDQRQFTHQLESRESAARSAPAIAASPSSSACTSV